MVRSRGRFRAAAICWTAGFAPTGVGAAAAGDGLVAEVRVFEIRRPNSDFSPIQGLSFQVNTDGAGVRASEWLATLARRVPDGYLAQLLTFGPMPTHPGRVSEDVVRRGRRAVRVRLSFLEADGDRRRFEAELALLGPGSLRRTIRREAAIGTGNTLMMSGRDFEISLTEYLSWFREPGDRTARGALYEKLRDHSVFLAFGITVRAEDGGGRGLPVRLRAPEDPRLLDIDASLVGATRGTIRLRLRLDAEGVPQHTEVLETTFPEVTPRVLGIASDWRFPQAAGRVGLLTVRVASR